MLNDAFNLHSFLAFSFNNRTNIERTTTANIQRTSFKLNVGILSQSSSCKQFLVRFERLIFLLINCLTFQFTSILYLVQVSRHALQCAPVSSTPMQPTFMTCDTCLTRPATFYVSKKVRIGTDNNTFQI